MNLENGESFFEVVIRFEIDGHMVEHKSAYKYTPQPGLAEKGFVFGNLVVEACESLKSHLCQDEWDGFRLSLTQLDDDEDAAATTERKGDK